MLFVFPVICFSQSKYYTREGHIHFKSEAKLEIIEANNYKVNSVLDLGTGNIEFAVLIKAFEFKKALMEEHFNENYLESKDYPKSIFKGKLIGTDSIIDKKDGVYQVQVEGELTLHGVTKELKVPANLTVDNGIVKAESSFTLRVEDFDIKIPAVVTDNIAREISVNVTINYKLLEHP